MSQNDLRVIQVLGYDFFPSLQCQLSSEDYLGLMRRNSEHCHLLTLIPGRNAQYVCSLPGGNE